MAETIFLLSFSLSDSFVSGQYLVDAILKSARLELAFVWNRTCDVLRGKVDEELILEDLSKFSERLVTPVWILNHRAL